MSKEEVKPEEVKPEETPEEKAQKDFVKYTEDYERVNVGNHKTVPPFSYHIEPFNANGYK